MAFELTDEQKRLVAHTPGTHARVLAGPGTGKSATVVKLLDRLQTGENQPRVRLMTFTRAATSELAQKILEHESTAISKPSTVHSFALSLLLQNPGTSALPRPLRIADDWERKNILNPTLGRRVGVSATRIDELFRELASQWESLVPEESPRVRPEDRAKFLAGWQEHRGILGYTLLAELPDAARIALRDHPDLSGADFDLLLVDEYQDLNSCDLELLSRLAARGASIVGVGDDDQSIYSFRRAAPEGIRRFATDYPGAVDYPLSITHRCGKSIVTWAASIIAGDLTRAGDRAPLTPAATSPDGEVALLAFGDNASEAAGVAKIVANLVNREGVAPEDILILLRSDSKGAWSGPIGRELDLLGIPHADPDLLMRILDRKPNRGALSMLRLLVDSNDSLAWASLMKLEPGVGEAAFRQVYDYARASGTRFGEALIALAQENFQAIGLRNVGPLAALVERVRQWCEATEVPAESESWSGFVAALAATGNGFEPDAELLGMFQELDALADKNADLSRFLGQVMPLLRDLAQSKSEGVRIMSMAASKGLTAEAVVVPGLEQGIIPRQGVSPDEDRRLLYVAFTRPKRFLFGTWARRRTGPTARSGDANVQQRRRLTDFLEGGPVTSTDGAEFLRRRWP